MLSHQPSIFEKDVIDFASGKDISDFIARCAHIKKTELAADGIYGSFADDHRDVAYLWCIKESKCVVGIFSLKGYQRELPAYITDGIYENLLIEESVHVSQGQLLFSGNPLILKIDTDCFLKNQMPVSH